MAPGSDNVAHVHAVSRKAAARALVRDLVATAQLALGIGAAIAIAAVLASKAMGFAAVWPWMVGAPLVAALGWAAVVVWARRWSESRGARALDEQLRSQDRLISALELSLLPSRTAFEAIAVREGEQFAASVEPDRAFPIRGSRAGIAALALSVGAIVAGLLVPERSPDLPADPSRLARQAQALREVQSAIRAVTPVPGETPAQAATASQLEALSEVERELAAGRLSPEEARAQSAKELNAAADVMEKKLDAQRDETDALRTRLAEAAAAPEPGATSADSPPATGDESAEKDPLTHALSRGDLDSAAQAARELASQADRMTPEARRELADDLRRLAEKMDEPHRPTDRDARTPDGESSGQPPSATGEHPERPAPASSSSQTQTDQPPTAESAPPSQPRSEAPQQSAADKARHDAQALGQALKDAAQELDDSPKPTPTGAQPPDASSPDSGLHSAHDQPKHSPGADTSDSPKEPGRTPGTPQDSTPSAKPPASPKSNQSSDSKGGQPASSAPDQKTAGELRSAHPDSKPDAKPDSKSGTQSGTISNAPPDGKSGTTRESAGNPAPDSKPSDATSSQSSSSSPERTGPTSASRPQPTQGQTARPGTVDRPADSAQNNPTPSPTPGTAPEAKREPDSPNTPPPPPSSSTRTSPAASDQRQSATGDQNSGTQQPSDEAKNGESTKGTESKDVPDAQKRQGNAPAPHQPGDTPRGNEPAPSSQPTTPGNQQQADRQGESEDHNPTSPPANLPNSLPSASALERMAQQFEKHAKDLSNSRMTREQAEKYRQQAQKLLENASPEQREQLENIAKKLANRSDENQGRQPDPSQPPDRDQTRPGDSPNTGAPNAGPNKDGGPQPGDDAKHLAGRAQSGQNPSNFRNPGPNADATAPTSGTPGSSPGARGPRIDTDTPRSAWSGQTDTLDVRRSDADSEKTIAQWYNPKGTPGTGAERASPAAQQVFQRAAQGAERAIEQQVVPNQYSDFVRRVFGRYVKRAAGEASSAPVIENAPDAKPPSKP